MAPIHHLSELHQIYQGTDRDKKSPYGLHDKESKLEEWGKCEHSQSEMYKISFSTGVFRNK